MNYTKTPLSFEEQSDLLIKRGLIVKDKYELIECLRNVNYTRLSAYWHTFQDKENNNIFLPNTNLETVWQRYVFDHELKLMVMDALSFVEVSILRTRLVEQLTLKYGPFGYTEKKNFVNGFSLKDPTGKDKFTQMVMEIEKVVSTRKERDETIKEYFENYSREIHLPLWILAECLSFGTLLTMFKHLKYAEKNALAEQFELHGNVLQSWLLSLNYIRNLCAHHDRLWNREVSVSPALPDKKEEWLSLLGSKKIFVILTILNYLIRKINPQINWQERMKSLLYTYPEIPIYQMMGFTENWSDSSLWK